MPSSVPMWSWMIHEVTLAASGQEEKGTESTTAPVAPSTATAAVAKRNGCRASTAFHAPRRPWAR
ncbi:hypothetical protein QP975_08035 [Corynebacterium mastitidis]|nr:hypothetical protein [Corynebacterium mastitidis]MDK8450920.1 hypothetical protein [Corynebacterium mastitidis]